MRLTAADTKAARTHFVTIVNTARGVMQSTGLPKPIALDRALDATTSSCMGALSGRDPDMSDLSDDEVKDWRALCGTVIDVRENNYVEGFGWARDWALNHL